MPNIITGPPEPGTYRYVVARWDWPRTQTYQVANYGETKKSRIVEWPRGWDLPNGRGNPNSPTPQDRRVVMAFVNDRHLRDRLCNFLGWHDITREWFASLEHPDAGPTPGVEVSEGIGEVVVQIE